MDRASPTIRKIRTEAERADAAVVSLGLALDGLSSNKRLNALNNTTRAITTQGREIENANKRAGNSMRNLGRETELLGGRLARLATGLRSVGHEIWMIARPAGMIFGLGAAIGTAVQAVGALSGGVIGLLPRIADLSGALAPLAAGFTGIGLAAVSAHLAFANVGKAMSGNKNALRELTPQARQFVAMMKQLRPVQRGFTNAAQAGIFPGATSALQRFRGAAPQLQGIVGRSSANLGGLIGEAGTRLTGRGFLRDLSNIGGQGDRVVRDMGRGVLNLASALRHVAVAAEPFTRWLSSTILLWTKHADVAAKSGRESGRLASFFDRTRVAMTNMGHILRNLWVTFRNLGQAARPLGEELWRAAERTTEGWARLTGTQSQRLKLTRDFLAMGDAVKDMLNLVGELGAAVFRMGASGALDQTVNNLRRLVPVLENMLNRMADTFGPTMANSLVALGNLVNDLTTAGSGPFLMMLKLLNGTLTAIHGVMQAAGPFQGVIATMFSTVLIARWLAKLGLIEVGWRRVAVAAGEAAVAESAAMGGAAAGAVGGRAAFGIGVGRLFGGGGAGGRGGVFSRIVGRAGPQRTGTMADFATGAAFAGGATGLRGGIGALRAGGIAGAGAMLGRAGGVGLATLGRGALAIGSKFILPLLALQGLIGAFTAQRSGGALHQAAQVGFGAVNALGMGIPGHFYRGLETPEQRAARAAGGIQRGLATDLAGNEGLPGLRHLNADLRDLRNAARSVADRQTDASRQLLQNIQQEIDARKSLVQQIKDERNAQSVGRANAFTTDLNKAMRILTARGMTPAAALNRVNMLGIQRFNGARGNFAYQDQLLRNMLGSEFKASRRSPALRAQYEQFAPIAQALYRSTGRNYVVGPQGHVFTGGRAEAQQITTGLQATSERLTQQGQRRLTLIQREAVASLIAAGMPPSEAVRFVRSRDGSGRGIMQLPNIVVRSSGPLGIQANVPRRRGRAAGGRIPGSGLQDTVPIGGAMAAPGELIVNRHTEARANAMLAAHGSTLGGLVGAETKRHSDRFAHGGRYEPSGTDLQPGISSIADLVLSKFPGLVITSTTGGKHAKNSYHYRGMAVDIGGAQPLMDQAGTWIQGHLARRLLEGIHNPSLSVKNGAAKSMFFWGPDTWAGHHNHIHLAAGGPALAQGVAATAASAGPKRKGPQIPRLGLNRGLAAAQAAIMGLAGLGIPAGRGVATGAGGGRRRGGGAPGATGDAQQIAKAMMAQHGWAPEEWAPLQQLWQGESGWSATIRNSSSNAQGIPQFLPMPGRATPKGFPDNPPVDARAQIAWGEDYIAGRYGTPTKALSTWKSRSPHWYEKGGRTPRFGGWHAAGLNNVFSTPTVIGVGEKGAERVTVRPAGAAPGRGGSGINATFHIYGGEPGVVQAEVEKALLTVIRHLDNDPVDGSDTGGD